MIIGRRFTRMEVHNQTLAAMTFLLVVAAACAAPQPDTAASSAAEPTPADETPEILIPAPDLAGITLRNQLDEPVSFEDLRGKPALLTFIYTRCPMPEMCPATTLRFKEVQQALSTAEREQVRLISVSFDPFDTPAVLAEYAALWEVDSSFWSLLTGDEESVQRVAGAYGSWYEQTDEAVFDHTMMTLVLFPDGSVHEIFTGSAWDSDAVARTLLDLTNAGPKRP